MALPKAWRADRIENKVSRTGIGDALRTVGRDAYDVPRPDIDRLQRIDFYPALARYDDVSFADTVQLVPGRGDTGFDSRARDRNLFIAGVIGDFLDMATLVGLELGYPVD